MWSCVKFPPQSAEKEPVPETIPSATTPKRHREEDDIPAEPLGDTKRVHVGAQVTVAGQFLNLLFKMNFWHQKILKKTHLCNQSLLNHSQWRPSRQKLTQLTMDIQSDNESLSTAIGFGHPLAHRRRILSWVT